MELYLAVIVIMLILAILGIVVGVANDAVNFLNTSLGSRVASFRTIMIMASIGLFLGTITSSGMMEIARKGMFYPQYFNFENIIYLFFAVMISNIIILNFFNILGLPTSTTVSLVFNLLGASLGIAILTYKQLNIPIIDFVNTEKTITIISGILLSVVLSLFIGVIIQFIVRSIFGFDYVNRLKYIGGIWASIVLTALIYFLFVKGFKDSFLKDTTWFKWMLSHQNIFLLINFFFWLIVTQILIWLKIKVFRFIVLFGTLTLAMSFAGNDLVNFIGVPLASINAFEFWLKSGLSADAYYLKDLNQPLIANIWYLLGSSIVMILTLWFSKQARYVTQTEINLTRQDVGYERFGSTEFSRALVRITVATAEFFEKITPPKIKAYLKKQFDTRKVIKEDKNASFDLIRASVTLMVASILIALGTSLKLPLSTTYVTFITAMGTSLADKAWGKESAVYRVTGVISVIIGWFVTGLVSMLVAFVIAILLFYTKFIGIGFILIGTIALIIYTRKIHQRIIEKESKEAEIYTIDTTSTDEEIFVKSLNLVKLNISKIDEIISKLFDTFINQDRKNLKNIFNLSIDIKNDSKQIKQNVYRIVRTIAPDNLLLAQYYTQITDALRDLANATYILTERLYMHIENSHDIFEKEKSETLKLISKNTNELIKGLLDILNTKNFETLELLKEQRKINLFDIENAKLDELKNIHKGKSALIMSDLFLNTLAELKNINIYSIRLAKALKRYHSTLVNLKSVNNN